MRFLDRIRPVHDRDVSPVNLEDNNLPDPDVLLLVVGQKEQVSPLQKIGPKAKNHGVKVMQ